VQRCAESHLVVSQPRPLNLKHVMPVRSLFLTFAAAAITSVAAGQAPRRSTTAPETTTLLVPDRVWDGVAGTTHSDWAVLVTGNRIVAALIALLTKDGNLNLDMNDDIISAVTVTTGNEIRNQSIRSRIDGAAA